MFRGFIDKKYCYKVIAMQYPDRIITYTILDAEPGKWIYKSRIDPLTPVRIHYERSGNNE